MSDNNVAQETVTEATPSSSEVPNSSALPKAEKKKGRAKKEKPPAPPKHSAKLETARSKLPTLEGDAQDAFNSLTEKLSLNDLNALSSHLAFHVRNESTRRAADAVNVQVLKVGAPVRVVGGTKFVGFTGVITKVQRIRLYVEVKDDEDKSHSLYLFTSDVEALSAPSDLEESEVELENTGT